MLNNFFDKYTVENLTMSSSEAPNEAKPISCENCAKSGFDNNIDRCCFVDY